MPYYMGKEISDDDLNALKKAYQDGQRDAGGDDAVENTDQLVLDRLAAKEVISPRAPSAYDLGWADAGGAASSGGTSSGGS